MTLRAEDINPTLLGFEQWLDETMPATPYSYLQRPAPECRKYQCPSRLYLGGIVMGATYEASEGAENEEFRSGKLDISLTRHVQGCGKAVVAKVMRASEVATKLPGGTIRAHHRKVELFLSRLSKASLELDEHYDDQTKLWLPGGGLEQTGTVIRRSGYPNHATQVDAFVQKMQDEITLGLQDNDKTL